MTWLCCIDGIKAVEMLIVLHLLRQQVNMEEVFALTAKAATAF